MGIAPRALPGLYSTILELTQEHPLICDDRQDLWALEQPGQGEEEPGLWWGTSNCLCSGWLEPPGQWLKTGKAKGESFTFWGHPRAMSCLTLKLPAHSLLLVHLSFSQVLMLAGAVCIPSPRPARFIFLYFVLASRSSRLSSWVITS